MFIHDIYRTIKSARHLWPSASKFFTDEKSKKLLHVFNRSLINKLKGIRVFCSLSWRNQLQNSVVLVSFLGFPSFRFYLL